MNTTRTKNERLAASIVLGSLIKIEGVKTPVVVTEVQQADFFTVSGPRGEFELQSCGTHWLRWCMRRGTGWGTGQREVRIEWVKAPADA